MQRWVLNVWNAIHENPDEDEGGWKVKLFENRRYRSKAKREDYMKMEGLVEWATPEQEEKDNEGLLFFIDLYDHSGTTYSLHGNGQQCRFDTSRYAGVIEWEGEWLPYTQENLDPAALREKRVESATGYLEYYTAWANGHLMEFRLSRLEDDDGCIDSVTAHEEADVIKLLSHYVKPGEEIAFINNEDYCFMDAEDLRGLKELPDVRVVTSVEDFTPKPEPEYSI